MYTVQSRTLIYLCYIEIHCVYTRIYQMHTSNKQLKTEIYLAVVLSNSTYIYSYLFLNKLFNFITITFDIPCFGSLCVRLKKFFFYEITKNVMFTLDCLFL